MSLPPRPQPQPGIAEIACYVPGKSGPAGTDAVKLSANESPLGASPAAIRAFGQAATRLERYPQGSSQDLRDALAEVHGVPAQRVVCGNGSDDLLHLLAQCYLGEGDEAVMSQYGFAVYPIVTRAAGADVVLAEERDYTAQVDALLGAVTAKTRMVFLANPNNPTGTYLCQAEMNRLHAGLRPDIVLVVDNAYAEYAVAEDFATAQELALRAENVVMVRTFSKIGLAAARVGWLVGPDAIVDMLNRIRGPFNVNLPGQLAAAAAARDQAFTARLCAHNRRWRDWLSAELASNRLCVLPSQANFVLVLFETAQAAAHAFTELAAAGLIVRELGAAYGIERGLRISIGTETAMRDVAKILKSFG